MADRNSNWDRERDNERDDWRREDAWRRDRESDTSGDRYREYGASSDRPEERRPYSEMGRGEESSYARRGQYRSRGDYGPSAFNPGGGRDQELFGTGSRGFGTTWGGTSAYGEGRSLYQGGERNYMEGQHAGKGPKGYRRSDDRIREDVCDHLTRHGQIDASELEVEVRDGEVTLAGTVQRREEKRLAEDVAERISGVRDVHNQLRAQPQESGRQLSEASRNR